MAILKWTVDTELYWALHLQLTAYYLPLKMKPQKYQCKFTWDARRQKTSTADCENRGWKAAMNCLKTRNNPGYSELNNHKKKREKNPKHTTSSVPCQAQTDTQLGWRKSRDKTKSRSKMFLRISLWAFRKWLYKSETFILFLHQLLQFCPSPCGKSLSLPFVFLKIFFLVGA